MKNTTKIYLTTFIFLMSNAFVYSQHSGDIYPPKGFFEISTPTIAHASNVSGESGFSILFSYPGFFSLYGQPSVYYTTSGQDSYSASVGELYLMAGIVKSLPFLKESDQILFFNLNVGTMSDEGLLGSVGFSFLKTLPNKDKIEVIADLFMNPGLNGDMFISDKPSSHGLVLFCNYSHSVIENLTINAGLGISYIRFRYIYTPHSSIGIGTKAYQYEYVSKTLEKFYLETGLGVDPRWDSHIIFPFGITVSYHF